MFRKATNKQIRKARALLGQISIGEEERRDFQEAVTGKRSMADMSVFDMKAFIPAIRNKARLMGVKLIDKGYYERKSNDRPAAVRSITPPQFEKILALTAQIGLTRTMLEDFISARVFKGWNGTLEQLNVKAASKVIEVLKARAARGDKVIPIARDEVEPPSPETSATRQAEITHVDFRNKRRL